MVVLENNEYTKNVLKKIKLINNLIDISYKNSLYDMKLDNKKEINYNSEQSDDYKLLNCLISNIINSLTENNIQIIESELSESNKEIKFIPYIFKDLENNWEILGNIKIYYSYKNNLYYPQLDNKIIINDLKNSSKQIFNGEIENKFL